MVKTLESFLPNKVKFWIKEDRKNSHPWIDYELYFWDARKRSIHLRTILISNIASLVGCDTNQLDVRVMYKVQTGESIATVKFFNPDYAVLFKLICPTQEEAINELRTNRG